MTLQLREGGYYKTRDGQKVGPMLPNDFPQDSEWAWMAKGRPCGQSWRSDGSYTYAKDDPLDIISEWPSEGPVRTVTRTVTEIVPGNYGIVMVYMVGKSVRTEFNRSDAGPDELKAAAAVLLELAGALDSE